MDYSLLVGVVEPREDTAQPHTESPPSSFRVRIVDYIGAFTLAKQLESSSKNNVTILPPAEYAQRFQTAMESYFIACPGEWA
jgi:hypothetical protein